MNLQDACLVARDLADAYEFSGTRRESFLAYTRLTYEVGEDVFASQGEQPPLQSDDEMHRSVDDWMETFYRQGDTVH